MIICSRNSKKPIVVRVELALGQKQGNQLHYSKGEIKAEVVIGEF